MDASTIAILASGLVLSLGLATGWLFMRGIGDVLHLATEMKED